METKTLNKRQMLLDKIAKLEWDITVLKGMINILACPSPVDGFLASPIPKEQRSYIDSWLENYFGCDHHGESYFDGVRYCVLEISCLDLEFPLPMENGIYLMVKFSNTDENGTQAHDAWFAVKR